MKLFDNTCPGLIFLVGGVFILVSIIFRWNPMMNHYKVKRVYRILGQRGSTIFYIPWDWSSLW
jgi:hypothetical protein